ncbi:MAG TPA: flippase [Candidatus Binatia bacterium]
MELRSFARGGLLGLLALVVEKAVALVLVIGLARLLSPVDYGRYSFLIAYLTLFQVLAELGTEQILLRRLGAARERAERDRLVAGALGLRVTLALVACASAVALAPLAGGGDPALLRRTALAGAALLFTAQPGYRALFRAELRMGAVLGCAVATNALVLALVGVALAAGFGLDGVLVALAAANLAGFAVAAFVGRDLFRLRLAVDLPLWRELVHDAWPVGANVFVITLALRMGPLLLMRLRGPVEVGWFSSASRLVDALNLLPDAAMLTVYPLFVRFATTRPDSLRALAEIVAKLLAVALLCVIVVVSQVASEVMGGLFRPEFAVAGGALALLSWSALLAALGAVYGNLLIAVGRQRVLFRVNCAAVALQIVLQLVLIPWRGVDGAALAVVLTAVASHATLYALAATRTWVRPCVHAAAAPTGLALVLLGVGGMLPGGSWARAAVLLAAFLALLLLTRLVGARDVRVLRELLRTHDEEPVATPPVPALEP